MSRKKGKFTELSPLYLFVRARQLEGTYSPDPTIGTWPITSLRVACGRGCVPEHNWPYSCSHDWPPKEPPNLDTIAKQFRIQCYQRIRSLEECKLALQKGPITAAFEITNQWFNAKNGVIEMPQQNAEIVGSHGFTIVGYEDDYGAFRFANSWGEKWGDKGYGLLPYEYFEPHLVSAWTMYPDYAYALKKWARERLDSESPSGIHGSKWSIKSIIGNRLHAIEIYDFSNDERIGWCFAISRDGWLEVEEFFVRPAYRRQGYGKDLCDQLLKLSSKLNLPLRLWIPHADAYPSNQLLRNWLASYLGLHLSNSEVRWARYRAELKKRPIEKSIHIKHPARPQVYPQLASLI